jgi:hypothetical protein
MVNWVGGLQNAEPFLFVLIASCQALLSSGPSALAVFDIVVLCRVMSGPSIRCTCQHHILRCGGMFVPTLCHVVNDSVNSTVHLEVFLILHLGARLCKSCVQCESWFLFAVELLHVSSNLYVLTAKESSGDEAAHENYKKT